MKQIRYIAYRTQFLNNFNTLKKSLPVNQNASRYWYLLPIFLGFIGGLILFLTLRKEDAQTAETGLVLGVIMTVAPVIIYFVVVFGVGYHLPQV